MAMRVPRLLLLCPAVLMLATCSLGGPLREDRKASGYQAGRLGDPWRNVKIENGADLSFQNARSGSMLALNSLCDRYKEANLHSLTQELLGPLQDPRILLQEKKWMDGREGLYTRARGTVDGVPVESMIVVYRKNNCIFDITLNARGEVQPRDVADFQRFVDTFKYNGGSAPKDSERMPGAEED